MRATVDGASTEALHGLTRTPGRQHGHRRDRGLHASGWRSRASATAPSGTGGIVMLQVGFSHPVAFVPPPGRDQLTARGQQPHHRHAASTRSWSARRLRASGGCGRRSPTRARASATPNEWSDGRLARPARKGRSRSSRGSRSEPDCASPCAAKRHRRIRRTSSSGTAERPRLAVFRSLSHIYCQVIDDGPAATLAAASDLEPTCAARSGPPPRASGRSASARSWPSVPRKRASKKVVFDRGGFLYHGRVKALADGAREGGLKF